MDVGSIVVFVEFKDLIDPSMHVQHLGFVQQVGRNVASMLGHDEASVNVMPIPHESQQENFPVAVAQGSDFQFVLTNRSAQVTITVNGTVSLHEVARRGVKALEAIFSRHEDSPVAKDNIRIVDCQVNRIITKPTYSHVVSVVRDANIFHEDVELGPTGFLARYNKRPRVDWATHQRVEYSSNANPDDKLVAVQIGSALILGGFDLNTLAYEAVDERAVSEFIAGYKISAVKDFLSEVYAGTNS